ncbi:hypothetical protein [Kordiimonas pumila]|uniref:Uncharacterized protein n=1 Tax=Kordiimonas pumila TaxID=2161677 RepID=A0ABV7D4S0_9PROT|nr:hypothetical protein [Kordiimonas pumila]
MAEAFAGASGFSPRARFQPLTAIITSGRVAAMTVAGCQPNTAQVSATVNQSSALSVAVSIVSVTGPVSGTVSVAMASASTAFPAPPFGG